MSDGAAPETHEFSGTLNRKPRRAFVEWAISAVVLIVLVGMLTGKLMLRAIQEDGTGLSLLVSVMFGLALVRNLFDVLFIDSELTIAHSQVKKLLMIRRVGTFIAQIPPSLLGDHLTNLFEIARRDHAVSQDNLVALLQTRLNSRLRVTELASSVLVTLGLIGTIIGLIGSVAGVSTVVESVGEDQKAMLSGMKVTLGGMGTAFFTTLLGAVLGGVVLRILASIVRSHGDVLVAHIAELSEVYVLPTLRKSARSRDETEQTL